MKKTIYVPSQKVWDGVKDAAKEAGVSVSRYLIFGSSVGDFGFEESILERLGVMESKLDKLLLSAETYPPTVFHGIPIKKGLGVGDLDLESTADVPETVPPNNGPPGPGKMSAADRIRAKLGPEKKAAVSELRDSGHFNPQPKRGGKK